MGHRMPPITFLPTDLRCHGNEIQDKFHCNSASVRNFFEIFLPKPIGGKGFRGWAIGRCQLLFSDRFPLVCQRNL